MPEIGAGVILRMSNLIENAIATLSPAWAAKRAFQRHQFEQIQAQTGVHRSMQQMMGGKFGGYEAGKLDRLKGRIVGSPHENDIPRQQIRTLRYRSWNLYRNCPQARKIRRSLAAKVIGRGPQPQPQSTTKDGKPFVEFRKRAREVFTEFAKESDWRGKPGLGGTTFTGQCELALGANLLSGGVLYQIHDLSTAEQKKLGLFLPLQIQLLHVDRLDETKNEKNQFHGVQTDDLGRVTGFWIIKGGTAGGQESEFVAVEKMRHLFAEEDIDQFLGSPWFGAALLTMDDRRNYEYSELVAAEMASCVVGIYRLSPGQTQFAPQGNQPTELTDADGNPITRLQPGMLLNGGANGEFDIKSSDRPNSNADTFLSHLIRSEAVSVPGIKGSTLTSDYRNSSFSSERSADNDIWPEIESLQDWFSVGFCQPIYEAVIKAAVLAGKFKNVPQFSTADFDARQREYLNCNWQGPVSRSINPTDDAEAAMERVANGQSCPQIEANKDGREFDENIAHTAEAYEKCIAAGLPEEYALRVIGIAPKDMPQPQAAPQDTGSSTDKKPANRIRNFVALNSA